MRAAANQMLALPTLRVPCFYNRVKPSPLVDSLSEFAVPSSHCVFFLTSISSVH